MDYLVKDIADNRAMTDMGAGLFIKRGGDKKYHLWLPLTNIPATGSAPETVDTTVTTSRMKTSTPGRQDPGQKECTFMAHRDNFEILKNDSNKILDFLQVNPDGTGFKFQGKVSMYQDETSVGSNLTGKAVITVASSEELPISNVADLIQETVTFVSSIEGVIKLEKGKTYVANVETDPAEAIVTATSDTENVATVACESGVATITAVESGSAIIKITAKKDDCADGVTHILVIVK